MLIAAIWILCSTSTFVTIHLGVFSRILAPQFVPKC